MWIAAGNARSRHSERKMWIATCVLVMAAVIAYFCWGTRRDREFRRSVSSSVRLDLERNQPKLLVETYMNSALFAAELKLSCGVRSHGDACDHLIELFHDMRPEIGEWVAARNTVSDASAAR
jgi:hypothetical protein